MQNISENRRKINELYQRSGKYHPDAYEFITSCVIEQVNALPEPRHLSAAELLTGLKKQFQSKFGFLAADVLESWSIKSASDIGEIIFDLISLNILSASKDDRRCDFDLELKLTEPLCLKKASVKWEVPQID